MARTRGLRGWQPNYNALQDETPLWWLGPRNSGLAGNFTPAVKIISTIRLTIYGTALYTRGGECALCQREGRIMPVLKVMLAASIVAIVALGTAAASGS